MKFAKISEKHIRDAIDETKTSKGFRNDNISSYILKHFLPYIIKSLAYICSKSLEKREFPALWTLLESVLFSRKNQKNYGPIFAFPVVYTKVTEHKK